MRRRPPARHAGVPTGAQVLRKNAFRRRARQEAHATRPFEKTSLAVQGADQRFAASRQNIPQSPAPLAAKARLHQTATSRPYRLTAFSGTGKKPAQKLRLSAHLFSCNAVPSVPRLSPKAYRSPLVFPPCKKAGGSALPSRLFYLLYSVYFVQIWNSQKTHFPDKA